MARVAECTLEPPSRRSAVLYDENVDLNPQSYFSHPEPSTDFRHGNRSALIEVELLGYADPPLDTQSDYGTHSLVLIDLQSSLPGNASLDQGVVMADPLSTL